MCVNNQLPVFPTEKVKECVMIVNVMETVTFHEQENHYGAGDVTGQDRTMIHHQTSYLPAGTRTHHSWPTWLQR